MAEEKESRECVALRKHYTYLRNTVNSDLNYFAGAFYQKGFISRDIKRKSTNNGDADVLLDGVLDQLENSHDRESRFRDFVAIFSAQGAYKDVSLTLEDAYVGSRPTYAVDIDTVPLSPSHDNKEVPGEEQFVVHKKDVHSACEELERSYKAKLKREFSHLVRESIKELKNKLKAPEEIEKFKNDLKWRYKIKDYNEVEEVLRAVCEKENIQLDIYQELFSILEEYVDEETSELRISYRDLVTGWHEVKSFYERFEKLAKIKYARTLQVRYKVRPRVAEKIKNIWKEICERFELPPIKVLLYDETYGSLLLTWCIDADEEKNARIRVLLIQNLSTNIRFFQESTITHLLYNFEVLYSNTDISTQIDDGSEDVMLLIKAEFQETPLLIFDIDPSTCRVFELKKKIERYWSWLKYFVYHLQFSEEVLEDSNTLLFHGIKDQSFIILSSRLQEITQKHTYVWNLCSELSKEVDIELGEGHRALIPDTVKKDIDHFTFFIGRESCKNFYLVHMGSRDQLQATNSIAWRLLHDLETKPFAIGTLKKVVEVRVYEMIEEVEGKILGYNLTKIPLIERIQLRPEIQEAQSNNDDERSPSQTPPSDCQGPSVSSEEEVGGSTNIPTSTQEQKLEPVAFELPLAQPDPVSSVPPPHSLSPIVPLAQRAVSSLSTNDQITACSQEQQYTPLSSPPPSPSKSLSYHSETTSRCNLCLRCFCCGFTKIFRCLRISRVINVRMRTQHLPQQVQVQAREKGLKYDTKDYENVDRPCYDDVNDDIESIVELVELASIQGDSIEAREKEMARLKFDTKDYENIDTSSYDEVDDDVESIVELVELASTQKNSREAYI